MKQKIIYIVITVIMLSLVAYIALTQSRVRAAQDILQAQARLDELELLIKDAKAAYDEAEKWKTKCIKERDDKKAKAHENAENYRKEQQEIQGFLLGR